MSVAQDNLNTGLGPPPLATPITAGSGDSFGIPLEQRGLASGNLHISWVGWFNGLAARLRVLLYAIIGRLVIDNANITATTPAANSNTLTFVTGYTSTANDIGNPVTITGGVNVNLGVYLITAQTATTWTLAGSTNLTTAAGAGAAITGYMGGNVLTHFGNLPKVTGNNTLAESAVTDDGTNILIVARGTVWDNNVIIRIKDSGGTARLVFLLDATNPDILHIRNNQRAAGGSIYLETLAGGGAGLTVDNAGNTNIAGVYRVAATQVVGPQLAAIAAPAIATTAVGGVAGAVYTAVEQGIINTLITAVNQLNTDVANLATTDNTIRARFTTHGLTL